MALLNIRYDFRCPDICPVPVEELYHAAIEQAVWAEDLAVLDRISKGRISVTVAGGYVPSEFEMFGHTTGDRVRLTVEMVETLKAAWTGEPFEFRGRTVRVTSPTTPTPPGPRSPPTPCTR